MQSALKEGRGVCRHEVAGEELFLLPEKAVWWHRKKTLLLADLHLGKSAHFRRNGLNVPMQVLQEDLLKLERLIVSCRAEKVIALGDLFHAKENSEWESFGIWLNTLPAEWHLIRGNHDVLPLSSYLKYNIRVHENSLELDPFFLTHFPYKEIAEIPEGLYNLAGHIHPGIILSGKAHQHVRCSCFVFADHQGILPAFGRFTGNEIIAPSKNDDVYVIAGNEVIAVR